MTELSGKVAVVTGGGSGIGRACAELLAARGARVVVADLDVAAARDVAAATGGLAVETDVSSEESVTALAAAVASEFGGADVLHNNAAFTTARGDRTVTGIDVDLWDRTMAVNVRGYALCAKHLLPQMIERGGGSVINTASIAALRSEQIRAAYATSKAAIVGFSQSLAVQYGRFGIRSNAIAPGFIVTPALESQLSAEVLQAHAAQHPVGRLGTPGDVAGLVCFLASDRSTFITGALIPIDGALTVQLPAPGR